MISAPGAAAPTLIVKMGFGIVTTMVTNGNLTFGTVMINMRKLTIPFALFLAALLLSSCKWDLGTNAFKTFDYDLRGTWLSNDPSVYSGQLVITSSQITITGYSESQTPFAGDDNKRPFKGFTKGTALTGYSEDGKIYIEDTGLQQEGIPYTYYTNGTYPQDEFLQFNFGGRAETLQKQ